jgi:hypothetical protein
MRVAGEPYPIIPHEFVEKIDCCGCLVVIERGDLADLTCNECGAVVRTVQKAEAAAALAEIESPEICRARCTHCGALNIFPGFSAMDAFICSECGEGVVVNSGVQ